VGVEQDGIALADSLEALRHRKSSQGTEGTIDVEPEPFALRDTSDVAQ
jgi:hypothetical protein